MDKEIDCTKCKHYIGKCKDSNEYICKVRGLFSGNKKVTFCSEYKEENNEFKEIAEVTKFCEKCEYYFRTTKDINAEGTFYQHFCKNIKEECPFIKKEAVNHPTHYNQGKVECIEAIESATIGKKGIEAFCVGNILKYLWRYENKNGLEDVKKSQFYLNKLIEILERKKDVEHT